MSNWKGPVYQHKSHPIIFPVVSQTNTVYDKGWNI